MDWTLQEIEEAFLNQNDLMLAELHVKVLRSLLQREDITYNKEVDVRYGVVDAIPCGSLSRPHRAAVVVA
jgi:hypothetical protein